MGSGTVNCQYHSPETHPSIGSYDELSILAGVITPNAPLYYAIQSGPYPMAYLRMDGTNVNKAQGPGALSSTVSIIPWDRAPASITDYEVFRIVPL